MKDVSRVSCLNAHDLYVSFVPMHENIDKQAFYESLSTVLVSASYYCGFSISLPLKSKNKPLYFFFLLKILALVLDNTDLLSSFSSWVLDIGILGYVCFLVFVFSLWTGPKDIVNIFLMYAVNTYGFSADNRRGCILVHWKSIAQRHWADILLASKWTIYK